METLVATVLIVVVFMVASMVLNTLFSNSISQNDQAIRQELLELQYRYEHQILILPYYAEMGTWQLEVTETNWKGKVKTVFRAVHGPSQREMEITLEHATN